MDLPILDVIWWLIGVERKQFTTYIYVYIYIYIYKKKKNLNQYVLNPKEGNWMFWWGEEAVFW